MNSFKDVGVDSPEQNEDFAPSNYEETRSIAQQVADGVAIALAELHNRSAKSDGDLTKPVKANVTTKIELEKENSLKNDVRYFYGFSNNLLQLDLTPTEFKIIIHILETLKWGNVVAMTQKSIANNTKISP